MNKHYLTHSTVKKGGVKCDHGECQISHCWKEDQSRRSKDTKRCILIFPSVAITVTNNHKYHIQVTVFAFASLNHPHYLDFVSSDTLWLFTSLSPFVAASIHYYINDTTPPRAFPLLSFLSIPKSPIHLACGCVYWACVYMSERECACYLLWLLLWFF